MAGLNPPTPLIISTATSSIHPSFVGAFSGLTVTLLSSDNISFPISPESLTRTSGYFRMLLTLPQGTPAVTGIQRECIPLTETSDILASLLSMISGIALACPPIHEHGFAERLLKAAEKYEMPMPIAFVRSLLSPSFDTSAIRLYGIACRMNWEAEARGAATRTLGLDLMAPENLAELGRLDTPHLLKLLSLHNRRRKAVAEALDDKTLYSANERWNRCTRDINVQACDVVVDHPKWLAFKLAWSREPWRFLSVGEAETGGEKPAGQRIPELEALLDDRCGRCNRNLYSRTATLDNLRQMVQKLPKTIEVTCSANYTSDNVVTNHLYVVSVIDGAAVARSK
ncbi:hypothetical protein GSI_06738 [Ganoderma sinense ZZ0214-1]|uniref:BTB domain-containing protein n=1 Tax=Ganoderma sinense ZZ0214-1 TaxID=1077348 RepID=A0A2G8SE39_9APHY|nr:hypothetical protein GSI_06738 [Ganoderma sinense ZZ0214-1]